MELKHLPYYGSSESKHIKSIVDNVMDLSHAEICDLLKISPNDYGKMREIIIPSEDDRENTEWTNVGGITVPTDAHLSLTWPRKWDGQGYSFDLHYKSIDLEPEWWAAFRYYEDSAILWFEAVNIAEIPMTYFKILPPVEIEPDKIIDCLRGIPKDRCIFMRSDLRVGSPMIEMTFRYDGMAHSVCDIGGSLSQCEELLGLLQKALSKCLTDFLWLSVKHLDRAFPQDIDRYLPKLNRELSAAES